jgi:phage FluMu gp28-like protein
MFFECEWAEDGSALLSWELLQRLAVPDVRVHAVGRLRAGVDVGRLNDLFALALVGQRQDPATRAYCDEQVLWHWEEYRNKPFAEQKQVIAAVDGRYAIDRWQIDRTGLGADLAEHFVTLWPERCSGRWFSAPYKERLALNLLRLAEAGHLILPNSPDVLAKLHAVKRHVSGTGLRYDADRNDLGHGDLFWAVALAAEGASRGGRGGGGMVKIL